MNVVDPTVRRALVVMAKEPAVGNTKTRLCPPLTEEEANSLYRCFLVDTLELVGQLEEVQPVVAYWPAGSERVFRRLAQARFRFVCQEGADLAERLDHALNDCLDEGYQQVVAVDSDSPTLPISHLRDAFSALDNPGVDVVLGPCADGGYYLIGLKSCHSQLFRGMKMSTATVAADTVVRGKRLGLRFAYLPTWYDVDTGRDLARLMAELRSPGYEGARHTRAFLRQTSLGL